MKRTYICHITQLKQAFLVLDNFKKQRMMLPHREGEETAASNSTSTPILSILDLPPEVMYMIFSYCDAPHLVTSVQYVCNSWHELLQAVHVWKGRRLIFGRDMPCHELMSYIRCAPSIDAISYTYTSCHRFVPCLITNCYNLSWLKLHGDFFVPYSLLKNLINLQHLDLDLRWKFERKQDHDPDLTGISSVSSLQTLIVRNFNYHEKFVIECIKNCPNLRHIFMSKVEAIEYYVDPEKVEEGINSSSNQLETVYVFGAQSVGRELLELVAKPDYRGLRSLVLKPNDYTDYDFTNILFRDKFPEMVTLDIGYSNLVTDSSMPLLVNCCPKLKNLCLCRCNIGDAALKLFLKKLPSLERLNLHGTLVSSELLHFFPSSFPNLKALNLCACRLVHQINLLPLLDALPSIMILDRRGDFLGGNRDRKMNWPFLPVRNALA
ncbi:uncharacterized protein LOC117645716 [Thrips palmi]|uniref:Uncharacterized protein LOC117645716 n=1 Tax=Thrips palmi TaxID=161013 RepID=A0A6P8ZN92_THRPL|nr:uncharacterized protein LOC117645716 [Thrips palmi]XP_034241948.1 uncharacterized protein LOC117645716 [Thrips palmi]XP_034241949.1 uncharacterized protein LOC117645716 [Thrips palmi]XP_034241950.1 uncharacterized protein LOC117645716 [Thrips palmi]XP_034241951.1 uncharacterized protein LOC117645716 [Thrips palmi]